MSMFKSEAMGTVIQGIFISLRYSLLIKNHFERANQNFCPKVYMRMIINNPVAFGVKQFIRTGRDRKYLTITAIVRK